MSSTSQTTTQTIQSATQATQSTNQKPTHEHEQAHEHEQEYTYKNCCFPADSRNGTFQSKKTPSKGCNFSLCECCIWCIFYNGRVEEINGKKRSVHYDNLCAPCFGFCYSSTSPRQYYHLCLPLACGLCRHPNWCGGQEVCLTPFCCMTTGAFDQPDVPLCVFGIPTYCWFGYPPCFGYYREDLEQKQGPNHQRMI